MRFTDAFIKRPVMGVALCILLVVLGLYGLTQMNVRQYPKLVTATITVTTTYSGTSAQSIQNFITSPLESELAAVENIDYMYSTSALGTSTITLYLLGGADLNKVFTDVIAKVNEAKSSLPTGADEPVIAKDEGRSVNPLYVAFTTDQLSNAQLVDWLTRNVQPQFYTVSGVASVDFLNPGLYMLVTLDPEKIAKYNLSPSSVSSTISNNNVQIAAGSLRTEYRVITNNVDGSVKTVDELKNLIITTVNGQPIRIGDVANVAMEELPNQSIATFNDQKAVVMTFSLTPEANALSVVKALLNTYENTVKPTLPSYINTTVVYNSTTSIFSAIEHVARTLVEAVVIVMVVMLLFLGSIKSLIVPIIAIPISIIANFAILSLFGYSINLITLLAMILAIGLVVDDAIVVLENIVRHIRYGETPFRAAIIGTREIAAPVIVMTFTLAVVFLPFTLTSGQTGPIYREFAVTLAGSVILSGVVSLTLSPMLVNLLYRNYDINKTSKFEHLVETTIDNINAKYDKALQGFLGHPKFAFAFLAAALFALISLPRNISSELTPTEDNGVFIAFARAPSNSTIQYNQLLQNIITERFAKVPFVDSRLSVIQSSMIINIAPLKEDRNLTQQEIVNMSGGFFNGVPGLQVNAVSFPEIQVPGSGFFNFAVAAQSVDDLDKIVEYAEKFEQAAIDQGILIMGATSVSFDNSKLNIQIDREKASKLGVNISNIASSLAAYLSGSTAARVSIDGQVYKLVTQLANQDKSGTNSLDNYYVTSTSGVNIPLTEVVTYSMESQPASYPRLNQLNSVSVQGRSTQSQSALVEWVQNNFYNYFPSNYTYSFQGDLRTYTQEGSQTTIIFGLAIIMIFLVLAIQFNSWKDGIVIMVTVPLAITGCISTLFILNLMNIPGATSNLYTTIGMMTLVGLITKHGILMCEVAKEEQILHGLDKREAIIKAARLRFRPILMTTLAMVAGLLPLLIGGGSGANARFAIAVTIVSGLSIGTLFTLFILPMVYIYFGKRHEPLPEFDETIPPLANQIEEEAVDEIDDENNDDQDVDDKATSLDFSTDDKDENSNKLDLDKK
ncbi:efflux RND transporter permease subunit [Psittacicella hinzii]|uniref:SSD domain-containing protein n=1 Tax=Psittacicella hinzii TaxID=2028575 RepID=A0A3A1YCA9_9GAMM|nr:efflux RND transporter permease subunit [Psittacicella hinzii]RIY34818.1 hypothetical protein CKF58_07635 [Psittacicella hinzii]